MQLLRRPITALMLLVFATVWLSAGSLLLRQVQFWPNVMERLGWTPQVVVLLKQNTPSLKVNELVSATNTLMEVAKTERVEPKELLQRLQEDHNGNLVEEQWRFAQLGVTLIITPRYYDNKSFEHIAAFLSDRNEVRRISWDDLWRHRYYQLAKAWQFIAPWLLIAYLAGLMMFWFWGWRNLFDERWPDSEKKQGAMAGLGHYWASQLTALFFALIVAFVSLSVHQTITQSALSVMWGRILGAGNWLLESNDATPSHAQLILLWLLLATLVAHLAYWMRIRLSAYSKSQFVPPSPDVPTPTWMAEPMQGVESKLPLTPDVATNPNQEVVVENQLNDLPSLEDALAKFRQKNTNPNKKGFYPQLT